MATYDDAAYDDDLADDWEAALRAEEEKEKAEKAAEAEREARKADTARKRLQKKVGATEGEDEVEDAGEGAGDMQARAQDIAGLDVTAETRVALAHQPTSTDTERAQFITAMAEQLRDHQSKANYTVLFASLLKRATESLDVEDLNAITRAVNAAAKAAVSDVKKPTQTSTGRGRNTDLDAFEGVTDRGGAAATDNENFM